MTNINVLLLLSSITLMALVLARGVALAKDIKCGGTTSSFGASRDDTMTGTRADNQMFGEAGDDTIVGKDGADFVRGDQGADILYGNGRGERLLRGGGFDAPRFRLKGYVPLERVKGVRDECGLLRRAETRHASKGRR